MKIEFKNYELKINQYDQLSKKGKIAIQKRIKIVLENFKDEINNAFNELTKENIQNEINKTIEVQVTIIDKSVLWFKIYAKVENKTKPVLRYYFPLHTYYPTGTKEGDLENIILNEIEKL